MVVTGAASGIGRAISIEVARRGFVTALWDVDQAGLKQLKAELCEAGAKHRYYVVDITNAEQVSETVAQVESNLGPITCLVNNAGINLGPCLFKNEPTENWMRVVNVNTVGMLNVTAAIFPLMAGRKAGHVVNISSVCGKSVLENHVVYGAGKFFLEGFSQGLRREGLLDGVKVTVIRPSAVKTSLGACSARSTDHSSFVQLDPESKEVENETLRRITACNLPWVLDAEEVGKVVANVIDLPASVAVNELNISAIGLPE